LKGGRFKFEGRVTSPGVGYVFAAWGHAAFRRELPVAS
jgi:hypothetical protein